MKFDSLELTRTEKIILKNRLHFESPYLEIAETALLYYKALVIKRSKKNSIDDRLFLNIKNNLDRQLSFVEYKGSKLRCDNKYPILNIVYSNYALHGEEYPLFFLDKSYIVDERIQPLNLSFKYKEFKSFLDKYLVDIKNFYDGKSIVGLNFVSWKFFYYVDINENELLYKDLLISFPNIEDTVTICTLRWFMDIYSRNLFKTELEEIFKLIKSNQYKFNGEKMNNLVLDVAKSCICFVVGDKSIELQFSNNVTSIFIDNLRG